MQRFLQQHDEVELSALGLAIATVVTVAEILKYKGLVVVLRAPSPSLTAM
jgi:DNA-binding protein